MHIIKPISGLHNNSNEISDILHKEQKPVFITKNGKGDMVVMPEDKDVFIYHIIYGARDYKRIL